MLLPTERINLSVPRRQGLAHPLQCYWPWTFRKRGGEEIPCVFTNTFLTTCMRCFLFPLSYSQHTCGTKWGDTFGEAIPSTLCRLILDFSLAILPALILHPASNVTSPSFGSFFYKIGKAVRAAHTASHWVTVKMTRQRRGGIRHRTHAQRMAAFLPAGCCYPTTFAGANISPMS